MKIPNNWHKVTLRTYNGLTELIDTDNDITNLINRLVVLTGESIEEVSKIKGDDKLIKKLSYLNELPTAKKNNWFIYKGDVFKLIDIENISNKDFIDLNDIIESEIPEGDKLAKCISKLYKPVFKNEYDYTHFLDLSIGKSYSTILFFWTIVKKYYLKYLRHSLIQMEKMNLNEIKKMKKRGVDIQSNKANVKKLIELLINGNGTRL
jgi:hypothetical protein